MRNVLILGAAGPLAAALAGEFAAHGYGLVLTDKDEAAAAHLAADLTERFGVRAQSVPFDACEFLTPGDWFIRCLPLGNQRLEGVVICKVPDPAKAHVAAILTRAAEYLEAQEGGFLAGPAEYIKGLPTQLQRTSGKVSVIRVRAQCDIDERAARPAARAIYRALTRGRGFIAMVDPERAVAAAARHMTRALTDASKHSPVRTS